MLRLNQPRRYLSRACRLIIVASATGVLIAQSGAAVALGPIDRTDISTTRARNASKSVFEPGVGKDLPLRAVPEPGVILSLAGGITTLLGLQRFRRRSTRMRRRDS